MHLLLCGTAPLVSKDSSGKLEGDELDEFRSTFAAWPADRRCAHLGATVLRLHLHRLGS